MSNSSILYKHVSGCRWKETIERTITHPGDGRYIDACGMTPLHVACSLYPSVEVIVALLSANFDATIMRDSLGRTPLHIACFYSSEAVVSKLLEANMATINCTDKDNDTPLECLCRCYQATIDRAVDSNMQPHDRTPSSFLARVHRLLPAMWNKAALLLKATYHSSIQDELPTGKQWRVLHACAGIRSCPSYLIKLAIKLHPDQLMEVDEDGNLPLHIASANPNISDKHKRNVLNDDNEEDNVVEFFTAAYPAAARIPNQDGKLPLDLVVGNGGHWKYGVESVLNVYQAALTVKDHESGLFPFMTAAAGNISLDTIFHLFRTCPELERFVDVERGQDRANVEKDAFHRSTKRRKLV